MEFALADTQAMLADTVRAVLDKFGPEYWREIDQNHRFPIEFEREAATAGLFGT